MPSTPLLIRLLLPSLFAISTAWAIEPFNRHYGAVIELPLAPGDIDHDVGVPRVVDITGDGLDDILWFGITDGAGQYGMDPEPMFIMVRNEDGLLVNRADEILRDPPIILQGGGQLFLPGDYNGDGRLDLFINVSGIENNGCDDPGGQNMILLMGEDGKLTDFTATHLPQFSDKSHFSSSGDLDGDGDLDIVVSNLGAGCDDPQRDLWYNYLLFNDGTGHFEVVADFSAGVEGTPPEVIIGPNGRLPEDIAYFSTFWSRTIDAEGDGDNDIALMRTNAVRLCPPGDESTGYCGMNFRRVLLTNDGTGHFSDGYGDMVPANPPEPQDSSERISTEHSLQYDLNGDGLDDLLLHQGDQKKADLGEDGNFLRILISNGDGTFRDETDARYPNGYVRGLGYFQLHDLDGDGHNDLFANVYTGDGVVQEPQVAVNDGEGNFRRIEDWVDYEYEPGAGPLHNWVVLDVDGDGGTDYWANLFLFKMSVPYGQNLDGTSGSDYLIGGAWDNVYRGLAGDDVLDGGLGDDRLDGGPGNDTLIGGKGSDRYVFHVADLAGHDTISDKEGADDRLEFKNFGLEQVDQASQGPNGQLVLSLTAGGSITIENHFQTGAFAVEKLQVGGETFAISSDPSFQNGPIESVLIGFEMGAGLNGNWWNGPARNGEGAQIEISHAGGDDLVFVATVYSYDTLGNQIFLVAVGPVEANLAEVDVFITHGGLWGDDFDPALVEETQWGTGLFTAESCDSILMKLSPNAEYQSLGYTELAYELVRLTAPVIACPFEG